MSPECHRIGHSRSDTRLRKRGFLRPVLGRRNPFFFYTRWTKLCYIPSTKLAASSSACISHPRRTVADIRISAKEIAERFRGSIQAGQLGDGDRLPTVRQTARDFAVAPGTAAKAYQALEREGLVITRTAAGTRVTVGANRAPRHVINHAQALADSAATAHWSIEDTIGILKAMWSQRVETDQPPTRRS